MRMKIKHIHAVNVSALEGAIKATILLTFHYGNTPEKFINKLFAEEGGKSIILSSNHMSSIQLKPSFTVSASHDEKKQLIEYVIRDTFTG